MDPKHALTILINSADRALMTKSEHLNAEAARAALTQFIDAALATQAKPVTTEELTESAQ
jgi:hypothetical protein